MRCQDPGCLKACPAPGAIVQYANGIVEFHQEHCIDCDYCLTGCPFNIPRLEGMGEWEDAAGGKRGEGDLSLDYR